MIEGSQSDQTTQDYAEGCLRTELHMSILALSRVAGMAASHGARCLVVSHLDRAVAGRIKNVLHMITTNPPMIILVTIPKEKFILALILLLTYLASHVRNAPRKIERSYERLLGIFIQS